MMGAKSLEMNLTFEWVAWIFFLFSYNDDNNNGIKLDVYIIVVWGRRAQAQVQARFPVT